MQSRLRKYHFLRIKIRDKFTHLHCAKSSTIFVQKILKWINKAQYLVFVLRIGKIMQPEPANNFLWLTAGYKDNKKIPFIYIHMFRISNLLFKP